MQNKFSFSQPISKKIYIDLFYNIKILSNSIFRNLRTYLYIFGFPIILSTIFLFYRTVGVSTMITSIDVTLILMIPPFMIMFIVNVTISEWKNSVFLKRIHSAGVSKYNFIISIFVFNLLLGYLSFFVCSLYIFLASHFWFSTASGTFWHILYQTMTTSTIVGILFGATMVITSSILLGTIISGVFKSVALSQSITAIILVLGLFFSDMVLTPERTGVNSTIVYLSYILPYKHGVWSALLIVCEGAADWIYKSVPLGRITRSFDLIIWLPVLTSILYNAFLACLAILAFKWDSK